MSFLLATDGRGIATLTLNRPEVANAYDEDLLRAMTGALEKLACDDAVRALVIRAPASTSRQAPTSTG